MLQSLLHRCHVVVFLLALLSAQLPRAASFAGLQRASNTRRTSLMPLQVRSSFASIIGGVLCFPNRQVPTPPIHSTVLSAGTCIHHFLLGNQISARFPSSNKNRGPNQK